MATEHEQQELAELIAGAIDHHVAKLHTLDEETVARLIKEHTGMVRDIELVKIELHGIEAPTVADRDRRTGGMVQQVETIDKRTERIEEQINNGGVSAKLGKGTQAAIITTVGLVLVAVITSIIDLLR